MNWFTRTIDLLMADDLMVMFLCKIQTFLPDYLISIRSLGKLSVVKISRRSLQDRKPSAPKRAAAQRTSQVEGHGKNSRLQTGNVEPLEDGRGKIPHQEGMPGHPLETEKKPHKKSSYKFLNI